jgi:hypothetical protein
VRSSPARTPFHALRSAALAVAIVALAAGAHVLSGGALPVTPVLLAVLALTGLVTTLATRFKLGFPVIAFLLGAGQLVLHEAFMAFGPFMGPGSGIAGTSPRGRARFAAAGSRNCTFSRGRHSPQLVDVDGACPRDSRFGLAAGQGRAGAVAARGLAPSPPPAHPSGLQARRRQRSCCVQRTCRIHPPPVAEPQARQQTRPARRRRTLLTPPGTAFNW